MTIPKNIALTLLLFVSFSLAARGGDLHETASFTEPVPKLQKGDFTDFKLDNGIQVIVVENHKLPRVSFQLYVDRPVILEKEYAGTGAIVGQMLRAGTTTRNKTQIDEAVDFIGATLSTDDSGATASGLSQHAETLVALLADCVRNPTFPEEEFTEVIKQNELTLASQKDNSEIIAENLANQIRFGANHPYGERMSTRTLGNISPMACRNFHKRYFRPTISYLLVVGDITPKSAKALAETYFGDWTLEGGLFRELFLLPQKLPNPQVSFVARSAATQSVINITYAISLEPGSKDAITATVLNQILGGRSNSRLSQNLQEDKAYTSDAYSELESDLYAGYFNVYANVRNEVTDSAIHEIFTEMRRLRNQPVKKGELEEAKRLIHDQFSRNMERPDAIARFALNTMLYDLPRNYYANYLAKLDKITIADVQRVASTYILPDEAHIVVVGDRNVTDGLQRFIDDSEIQYFTAAGIQLKVADFGPRVETTTEEVIARYIDAIGGRERLLEITDLTTVMEGEVQGMAMTMTQEKQRGRKMHLTVTMSGMVVNETIMNGQQAKVLQMGSPQELDEAALIDLREQSQIFPEARYTELGYTLSYQGVEMIEEIRTYVLRITSPAGKEITEYYDTESGLKLRTVTSSDKATITIDYDDYQEVEGLIYPHRVTSRGLMPLPLVFTLKSLTVNTGLSADRFHIDE